jgi:hypothetical protein
MEAYCSSIDNSRHQFHDLKLRMVHEVPLRKKEAYARPQGNM